MPAPPLLDRQVALLRHLTDADVIFGATGDVGDAAMLSGVDPGRLRLEAWFSFAKRIGKIETALPRTFKALGDGLDRHLRAFAAACPPHSLGRLANAEQFHAFMGDRWPDQPPYLGDLATIEITYARVRTIIIEESAGDYRVGSGAPDGVSVRRPSNVIPVRCEFDVRSLFEEPDGRAQPAWKDTPLLVWRGAGEPEPRIFEIPAWLFEAIAALDGWTRWTDVELAGRPDADAIKRDLVARGLLETRS